MKSFAIVFCMFLAANAFAQAGKHNQGANSAYPRKAPAQPEPKIWSKEPRSFMGVALGEPFAVTECPMKSTEYSEAIDFDAARREGITCFDNSMKKYRRTPGPDPQGYVQLIGPVIGVGYTAFAWLEAGRVRSISLTFDTEDFQTIEDLFRQRYGNPTSSEGGAVQSKGGATYPQTELKWIGDKTTILLERIGSRIDEGFADIQDNELTNIVQQRHQDNQAERANKL